MGEYVISLPCSLYGAATDMATASGFFENFLPLQSGERLPDHLITERRCLVTPLLSKREET
jgi:hypothetical protein